MRAQHGLSFTQFNNPTAFTIDSHLCQQAALPQLCHAVMKFKLDSVPIRSLENKDLYYNLYYISKWYGLGLTVNMVNESSFTWTIYEDSGRVQKKVLEFGFPEPYYNLLSV